MGARIVTTDGRPPVRVEGGGLTAIEWTLPVASARGEVGRAAGGAARAAPRVGEPLASRDHTGAAPRAHGRLVRSGGGPSCWRAGSDSRQPRSLPGDPSSAAFLAVAALIVPGSEVRVRDVGLNPTRTGALAILRRMGADIPSSGRETRPREPRGDLVVRATRLRGDDHHPDEVPAAVDELPVLVVAAALASGETRLGGAAELRVKEAIGSRRSRAARRPRRPDDGARRWPRAAGPRRPAARRGRVEAGGDHRIAMAFAVAGLCATGGVRSPTPTASASRSPASSRSSRRWARVEA
jgi:3-phosphoshikimate 1-carboxyvinyltransferase